MRKAGSAGSINDVLGSAGPTTQPKDFVMNAVILADELVESVIVAAYDGGNPPIGSNIVDKIKWRSAQRHPIGSLIHNQQVLKRFRWESHVASLHEIRPGHATPLRSVSPLEFTERERESAKFLLGLVLEGWLDDMRLLSYPEV